MLVVAEDEVLSKIVEAVVLRVPKIRTVDVEAEVLLLLTEVLVEPP